MEERRCKEAAMNQPMNVIVLAKENGQKFVFIFDEASVDDMLRTLAEYATNPEIDFSWYDAAMLSQKARLLMGQTPKRCPSQN